MAGKKRNHLEALKIMHYYFNRYSDPSTNIMFAENKPARMISNTKKEAQRYKDWRATKYAELKLFPPVIINLIFAYNVIFSTTVKSAYTLKNFDFETYHLLFIFYSFVVVPTTALMLIVLYNKSSSYWGVLLDESIDNNQEYLYFGECSNFHEFLIIPVIIEENGERIFLMGENLANILIVGH